MISVVKHFFDDIDMDDALEKIEQYTANWLSGCNLDWDEYGSEEDQLQVISEGVEAMTHYYIGRIWEYQGLGDYHLEAENNQKLRLLAQEFVEWMQEEVDMKHILNMIEERMISA